MSQDRSPIFWTRLLAVAFVTTGPLLHAGAPPASSNGYKIVPVTIGGRTIPVKVKDGSDPFKSVSSNSNSTDKYNPSSVNFSAESSMANKQFSFPGESLSKSGNSDLKSRDQDAFITKAYIDDTSSPADTKAKFSTTSASSRNATGFDKAYPTSGADTGTSRTVVLATSADQNRTAALGGPEKPDVLASNSMANKQYLGPGAQRVPDDFVIKENVILSRMTGIPNRPLTIDEVRNLINHAAKPNTDLKPDEPSKPLNDPTYKPEPLRDTPSPPSEDDKNDPVPPPGTMAAPENSEPLPQP